MNSYSYTEVCLVEIAVWFINKGDKVHKGLIEDDSLWITPLEYEKLPTPAKEQLSFLARQEIENAVVFLSDNIGFQFQFIGQGTDEGYSSALSRQVDQIGVDEVFQEWLPDLELIAHALLVKINKGYLEKSIPISNFVRFVTAWDFVAYKQADTPYGMGEYDEEWTYLGPVDLAKISNILPKESE